ncbi:type VII toxin-antitoxin system MntA family adenylyltransferase antitoxin [Maribrevibacterium harenarium]|uniref:type VII toxin-antitoxin system MntA family adenylyltransferase antitoxin n=1 Tax=Maribrevibacterium harenarium TaxID=2589817 RepID=UPI001C614A84|nr:nucleotidyltransferase domain-containing protein [Maribrevibacterium harenarium]
MDRLQQIVNLARQNVDVAALWLYGSRAKGTARDDSDFDLGILFRDYLADPLERRLRPELLALDWQRQLALPEGMISVADIKSVPIPLAMNIISGKLLHCENHDARLAAEGMIMSKAELDYRYHLQQFGG